MKLYNGINNELSQNSYMSDMYMMRILFEKNIGGSLNNFQYFYSTY